MNFQKMTMVIIGVMLFTYNCIADMESDFKQGISNKDPNQAIKYLTRSANAGYALAQLHLGIRYQQGQGVETDNAQAVKWFEKAAEQGNADAMLLLGEHRFHGAGTPKDIQGGISLIRKAAELNQPMAQTALGGFLLWGKDIPADYSEAAKWLKKAVDQNHKGAYYFWGFCLNHGFGVEKNLSEAMKWLKVAAEQGNPNAQYQYAVLCREKGLEEGENYSSWRKEYLNWLTKAAIQGLTRAKMDFLSEAIFEDKNPVRRKQYFEESQAEETLIKYFAQYMKYMGTFSEAEKNLPNAKKVLARMENYAGEEKSGELCNMLGYIYDVGIPGKQDTIKAYQYYALSVYYGWLESIPGKMSNEMMLEEDEKEKASVFLKKYMK